MFWGFQSCVIWNSEKSAMHGQQYGWESFMCDLLSVASKTGEDHSCVTSNGGILVLGVTEATAGGTWLGGRGLHILDPPSKQLDQLTMDSVNRSHRIVKISSLTIQLNYRLTSPISLNRSVYIYESWAFSWLKSASF